MVANVCSNKVQHPKLGRSRTQIINVRFSADVPSPADKASVFVDAVPAERKATSVNGLCEVKGQGTVTSKRTDKPPERFVSWYIHQMKANRLYEGKCCSWL